MKSKRFQFCSKELRGNSASRNARTEKVEAASLVQFVRRTRPINGPDCAHPQRSRCVHTRGLALEADTSLGSGRVTRVLERLIEERGRPEAMRSNNGPEFCSRRMLGWAEEFKIELVHIQPGRPMQNGHVESFACAWS